ncbi:MAG: hypothetical protein WCP39_08320 [Chlamydiota bacterium]
MNLVFSPRSKKQLDKLPLVIRKKAYKQFVFLSSNPNYPSLHAKKMSGSDIYEGRIDYHYRFTYTSNEEQILILMVGVHDAGLGKK